MWVCACMCEWHPLLSTLTKRFHNMLWTQEESFNSHNVFAAEWMSVSVCTRLSVRPPVRLLCFGCWCCCCCSHVAIIKVWFNKFLNAQFTFLENYTIETRSASNSSSNKNDHNNNEKKQRINAANEEKINSNRIDTCATINDWKCSSVFVYVCLCTGKRSKVSERKSCSSITCNSKPL